MSSKTQRPSAALKQGTLSFTSSKRTASAKATQKPKEVVKAVEVQAPPPPPPPAKRKETRKDDSDSDSSNSSEEITPIAPPEKRVAPVQKAAKSEKPTEDPEQLRDALNVDDQKWRKQHAIAREKMGHLHPIHKEGENKVHEILRVFDMSYEYGPCMGMSRLERWQRAKALGLNPPEEIREILETKEGTEDTEYAQSVLYTEV